MSAETKAEAQRRVRQALQHIQEAQTHLGHAQALLSSLIGALPAWERVGKTYDRVKASWHFVAKLRGAARVDLDGMSAEAFEARQRETTR